LYLFVKSSIARKNSKQNLSTQFSKRSVFLSETFIDYAAAPWQLNFSNKDKCHLDLVGFRKGEAVVGPHQIAEGGQVFARLHALQQTINEWKRGLKI
jgi:hypothetical protein